MTVPNSISETSIVGDGATVDFDFDFICHDVNWVLAYVDEVQVTVSSVALNADQENSPGGTATLQAAPANGTVVTIRRSLPMQQNLDFLSYGLFPSQAQERALDDAMMLIQQLHRDKVTLPKLGATDTTFLRGDGVWATPTGVVGGGGGVTAVGPGDAGIVGDGVANDFDAIQAVIDGNPGTVLLKAGTYNVNGGVLIIPNGSSLVGVGRQATILTQTGADTSMVELGESGSLADIGLRHLPGVAPASGSMVLLSAAARPVLFEHHVGRIINVWLDTPWEGIRLDSGQAVTGPVNTCLMGAFLQDIIINSLYSRGIVFRDVADAHLSKCWIDGGAAKRGYGIWFDGFNEGVEIAGAEVIYCEYGLVMQGTYLGSAIPALPDLGQRVSAIAFTNCFFDTNQQDGAYLDYASKVAFSNCWFAGNGRNGVSICNECWGDRFSTCTFYANHEWGLSTNMGGAAYDLHLSVVDSIFPDNYIGGVDIKAGDRRFTIRGNHFGHELGNPVGLGYGSAQYGVRVNVGASDRYTITDNLEGPNAHTVAFISDGGTGVNKNVANNY